MSRSTQQAFADPHQLDRVFRALGDQTRRQMLGRLASGSASVTQLAAPFAMSLPAASKHIRVLETAGLVGRSVEGRVHRCSLEPDGLDDARTWLETHRDFWEGTLDSLAEFVEEGQKQ
ncbi:MAG: ArsR/SmtB family transcription factor [Gaiellaceae bacterium]